MHVFLNGRCVPEAEAVIPVSDRGFLYGDGLFETLRVVRGHPFRWEAHLARLSRGAGVLRLRVPLPPGDLLAGVHRLVELNGLPDGILRLTLTRGSGPRGYSPRGADAPTLVMALHPVPAPPAGPVRVITSTHRIVAGDPLTAVKTCSKITWVMARAEAGALDGITRALVLALCGRLGLAVCEVEAPPAVLASAQGVFLTGSVAGVVDVGEWDGRPVPVSPVTARLRSALAAEQARG